MKKQYKGGCDVSHQFDIAIAVKRGFLSDFPLLSLVISSSSPPLLSSGFWILDSGFWIPLFFSLSNNSSPTTHNSQLIYLIRHFPVKILQYCRKNDISVL